MVDWRAVNPVIFGNISEACYSNEERLARGIYYTSEEDIMRIVRPLIVEPWERKISQIEQMPDLRSQFTIEGEKADSVRICYCCPATFQSS